MTNTLLPTKDLKDEEFLNYSLDILGEMLGNDDFPISLRIRLLWYLRARANERDTVEIISCLSNGLKSASVLLQHEICYVLGQIGNDAALPILYETLENPNFDVMTRHEAGEAVGAIKNPESIQLLSKFLDHEEQVIRETCLLAIKNIEKRDKENDDDISDEINSVDPTPSFTKNKTIEELAEIFLNSDESIYKRYKAMFSLRNRAHRGSDEAVEILCKGFKENEGALFKHEIAFVLGQLQNKNSAKALEIVLRNENEHAMVRHEAAEALGSICDDESLTLLEKFREDKCLPVKESCDVAIDMFNYWDQFEKQENNSEDESESD